MLDVGTLNTRKLPSARPNPLIALFNPFTVIGSPTLKLCGPGVVTVIKLDPKPPLATDASVITLEISMSVPGTS